MDILHPNSPDSNLPQKRCTGPCGRMLPATTEYFHRNGTGLRPNCKECNLKRVKTYYEQPEVHEQRAAYQKIYLAENQEHVRAHKKAYYSQPEVQEHKREYTREYRARPGKLDEKHAHDKKYLQNPKAQEKHRAYDRIFQHNRRARIRAIPGTHTDEQIQDLLKRQKHKCYYCSHKFVKRDDRYLYHIEHIVPISRGGSNDISNIVLACPRCNQRKQAKLPHEWPEGGRLL